MACYCKIISGVCVYTKDTGFSGWAGLQRCPSVQRYKVCMSLPVGVHNSFLVVPAPLKLIRV